METIKTSNLEKIPISICRDLNFDHPCIMENLVIKNKFIINKLEILKISRNFAYGVLDNLQSCAIRLPGKNQNKSNEDVLSELWLINEKAREKEIIESDRILPLKIEDYLV